MARRVFLHIGVPKSGTTYLQTTMWHNRAALTDQRFLYPGRQRMDHYHASHDLRGKTPRHSRNAGAWSRLVDELAAWDGDGLVSHEFFSMATAEQAREAVRALAPAEVEVVVTARDYVRQFAAAWQEALKMGSPLRLDEFMDKAMKRELDGAWSWNSQELPAIVERWITAVPAERVHLVTVPSRPEAGDGLWERWLRVIGVDDSRFDMSSTFSNSSLGVRQAALLMRVAPYVTGSLRTKPARHRWLRQYFAHEVLAAHPDDRFGLRQRHVEELAAVATAHCEMLAGLGCAVVGSLDDLVPVVPSTPAPHPDDVPDDEIVEVASRAIEEMIRDVQRLSGRSARRSRRSRPWRRTLSRVKQAARRPVRGARG